MAVKVFDFLVYGAATVVVLAIIAGATQAEREYTKESESLLYPDPSQPLIIEESAGVPVSDVAFAAKAKDESCKLGDGSCISASKSVLAKVKPKKQLRKRGAVVSWIKKVLEGKR
tara:strand:- start:419 stop:763 length:345 start_codon:yes stop_codon:yes gene_type:complete